MAWEAINNIAADKKRRVVIVVNDNGRSYAPTVGGFADYLASLRPTIDSLRAAPAYEGTLDWWKKQLQNGGPAGPVHLQEPARHEEGHQGLVGARRACSRTSA